MKHDQSLSIFLPQRGRWAAMMLAPLLLGGIDAAWAQSTVTPPDAPADRAGEPPATAPDTAAPSSGAGSDTPTGDLSKRLDRSNGVIVPKQQMDPAMHKPTPDLGPQSTPIIPPPGSPGGDQAVQPK